MHQLWPNVCRLLVESELPSRLVSLELLDSNKQEDSVVLRESFLFDCFPAVAPFPFLSLQHLTLPLGVMPSGRLAFPLSQLRHLPALHSLLLQLRVYPSSSTGGEDWKRWNELADRCEPILSQLSTISGLRWLEQR